MRNIQAMRGAEKETGGQRHSVWISTGVAVLMLCVAAGCKKPRINSPGSANGKVGEPFSYQITATRNPTSFDANVPPPTGLSVNTGSGLLSGAPQQDGSFSVTLKARNADGEGTKQLNLKIDPAVPGPGPGPGPGPSHAVVSEKELFIMAPAVLTASQAQPGGAWHIRSALQRIAGAGQDVEAFAQGWFATWSNNDSVSGASETFTKRPWVTTALQQAWQANRIRLIAIVNRIDLTRFPNGDATQPPVSLGEGRFVYEVLDSADQPLPFTIIFEYKLPIEGAATTSLTQWAQRWHALGRTALGGPTDFPPAYLTELQAITDKFSAHGTLNQIRANEFLPVPVGQTRQWELREFHFVDAPARLQQVTVGRTPAIAHNNQPSLANFINSNETDILAGTAVAIPSSLQAAVSPVPSPGFKWTAPGANARPTFITSFNTCSGCHAGDTGTPFQHIGVNAPQLSLFLRGSINLAEALPPTANTVKTLNEMADRRRILAAFAGDSAATPFTAIPSQSLSGLLKARANRPH